MLAELLSVVGLIRYVKISTSSEVLQVAELAVWTSDNVNVALNKPCTASPHEGPASCENAFNGNYYAQEYPSLYHSQDPGAFVQVDLGGNYAIDRIDYYNRAECCQARAVGSKVELLDDNSIVLARKEITSDALSTSLQFSIAASAIACDNTFEGGSWALVRRVKQGTTWHPATDDLAGTAVYGTYGSATSDSTFSLAFASIVSPSTELLFITGMQILLSLR